MTFEPDVTVVGAGLAGSEAAWQLAELGLRVSLVEMRPATMTAAHVGAGPAELVCSNSFRSDEVDTPAGLLKWELRQAGSLVMACAEKARVPAGAALAVDRAELSSEVARRLLLHPRVRVERRLIDRLPEMPTIVATGPLTHGDLAKVLRRELGGDRMYFYDAIAPIIAADSVDWDHAFSASRWGREKDASGDIISAAPSAAPGPNFESLEPADPSSPEPGPGSDYINCPLDRAQYYAFVDAVRAGRKVLPHEFEEPRYFESCMPIEVMADRGIDTLRFGPMKPIGLTDPRTGRWPFAVVQLRPENIYKTAYNLVGFQTRLAYPEQQRIFAMVPGLARAEFHRFGSIHRNTYIDAPAKLGPRFELRANPRLRFAGLLTGVEGYIESCATGLWVAWMLAAELRARDLTPPPATTLFGALHRHVTDVRHGAYRYQPTNVNFGLLPPLEDTTRRDNRKPRQAARARTDFAAWVAAAKQALA